jgi:phosphoribosylanthranilate isomerase
MRNLANIRELVTLPIQYIGFIFYEKSPRYIGNIIDQAIVTAIPNHICKTGVFVDKTANEVVEICKKYNLQAAQLHGNESIETVEAIKKAEIVTIKAFKISDIFDFSIINKFEKCCDYFLFDTYTVNHGGSGNKFNWDMLKNTNIGKPFFLSGGISINDIESIKALNIPKLYALDLNSKFELEHGIKNVALIKNFIENLTL